MISFNCNLPNSFMHPVCSSTRSCCLTHLTSQTAVVGKNVNAAIGAAEKQSRLREGSKPWWDLCLLTSLRVLIQKVIPESSARDQWGWLFSGLGLPHHSSDLGAGDVSQICLGKLRRCAGEWEERWLEKQCSPGGRFCGRK